MKKITRTTFSETTFSATKKITGLNRAAFWLLLFCFVIINYTNGYATSSSVASEYAVSGANAPVGPATYCSGTSATYTCTDIETSCSNSYGTNTNTISYQWYHDAGVVITGASGTYTASGTAHTVTLSTMPTLTPGTHTLYCTFTPNQSNCSYYSYTAITSPALAVTVGTGIPSPITGLPALCPGSTTNLSDATAGGVWSSSNPTIATVSSSGLVTCAAGGTDTISYTVSGGCPAILALSLLPAITGGSAVCLGSTTYLSDITVGGVWSSSNSAVATISTTGIVFGATSGTTNISYTAGACSVGMVETSSGAIAAITGAATVCIGLTGNLSDATPGGAWTSGDNSIATVSGSGVVTGVSGGTANISYAVGGGCPSIFAVTVPVIQPITGGNSVCASATTSLADATTGGTWSSGTSTVATISTAGVVYGVTTGTVNISYTSGACSITEVVTVDPAIPAIIGGTHVCIDAVLELSDATAGGTWSSSNNAKATVSSAGVVYGHASAPAGINIIYTAGGCSISKSITVTGTLTAITGNIYVCIGSPTYLSDGTAGGTWTSSNTSVATVSTTGIVYGITGGSTNISYTTGTCATGRAESVGAPVAAITGPITTACSGSTIYFSDASPGGTWGSSNTSVATVSNTGAVTGVAGGTPSIYYIVGSSCPSVMAITVTAFSPITGLTAVCSGSTLHLSDATASGAWSSSNTSVATVSAAGLVTGISGGTSDITYTAGYCSSGVAVTVNTIAAITGPTAVCVGSTINLSDATAGGTWSSNSTAKATIGSASGIVTGIASTTPSPVITYKLSTGCSTTTTVTVNSISPITGTADICASGGTVTLHDAATGGTWSTGTSTIATIGSSSGAVTGSSAGVADITYLVAGGCTMATATLTVNPSPASITGPTGLCVGSTITLSDATTGGTWSSNAPARASVVAGTGVVTGASSATPSPIISYTLPGGCSATTTVTVYSTSTITGASTICVSGDTVTLHDAASGGTWSTGSVGIATIGSTSGVVTGIAVGTADITYSTGGSCSATATLTVLPLPAAISVGSAVCVGSIDYLSDATAGGTWSSGNISIATIGAGTGIVSGVSDGAVTISYTLSGCSTTATVQVNGPQVPQICVVDVDSASGKNLVIWEQFTPNRVAWFNIYRENSSSVFVQIDSQAANLFSTYLDTGSYPTLQSYSYQLTATDSCGNESPLASSTIHTTVHLNANLGVGGVVNLIWNTYIGKPVTSQDIMRSVGGAPFVNIASVANTVTSYTDATPPSGSLTYMLNSVMASGCTPSARTTAYNYISSNPVYIDATGINTLVYDPEIHIYPNPASASLTITSTENITDVSIDNLLGQNVYSNKYNAEKVQVDISALSNGIYFVKVNGNEVRKFVKE